MAINAIIQQAAEKRLGFLGTIGKAGLNALFPNDFEYYLVAFELVDSNFKTLEYFIFPIMPSSLSESIPQITNIKKTAGGYSVVSSSQFISTDINLSGNFGRNFKVLLGQQYQSLIQSFKIAGGGFSLSSVAKGVAAFFDNNVKTGYGCIKVLERIINESKTVDPTGPRYLLFYNLALGNNYIVKPGTLSFSMSQDTNMIWNYTLQLKSLGRIENYIDKSSAISRTQLIVDDYVQKKTNGLVNTLSNSLSGVTKAIVKFV